MHDSALRARLVEHALAGRYAGFVRTGALLAIIGAILFVLVVVGEGHHRAWQAFHSTGCSSPGCAWQTTPIPRRH